MSPAFPKSKIAAADFRKLFCTNSTESALNEQGLDVGTGSTDSGSFLLSGALLVLRRKPSPGSKMHRSGKQIKAVRLSKNKVTGFNALLIGACVVCLLPQTHSNKLRLTALEVLCFILFGA